MDELQVYLDVLFDGLEGYIYSPVKTATSWETNWFEWPCERKLLTAHILNGGGDIYISPAIYQERRAVKEAIKKIQVVWIDFDGLDKIDFQNIRIPNLIVQTSFESKVHAYWRVDVSSQAIIEDTNRRLTYYLGADTGGWDSTQLLRPPSTINYKNNMPVLLTHVDNTPHVLAEFNSVPKVSAPPSEYILLENIPSVGQVISANHLPIKLIKMIKRESPIEPYRSSFLTRLANELAEEELSYAEIVSCLFEADHRIQKYEGRTDQLVRLSQLADYAIHKHIVEDDILVYTPSDILQHVDSIEWVLPQWLHTTGQLVLSSAPGVGKTQLTLQLAYCLTTQRRFLGLLTPTRKRVFYFSLEMEKSSLKYILEHQQHEWEEIPDFKIIDEGSNLKKYEDLIAEHESNVVIVDSMVELFEDAEDANSEARRVMKWCKKMRRRYGLAIILIHHNRKPTEGNKKPKNLSDLVGSYVFGKDSDTVIQLWEDYKGIELSGVKVRFGQKDSFMITRNDNLWFMRNASDKSGSVTTDTAGDSTESSSSGGHGNELHGYKFGEEAIRFGRNDEPK